MSQIKIKQILKKSWISDYQPASQEKILHSYRKSSFLKEILLEFNDQFTIQPSTEYSLEKYIVITVKASLDISAHSMQLWNN